MSIASTEVAGHVPAWCGKTRCWSCCPAGGSRSRTAGWSCTVMINKGKVSRRSENTAGILISDASFASSLPHSFSFLLFFFTFRQKYLRLISRSHTEQQHVLWALSPLHFKLIGHAVSLHFPSPGECGQKS